MISCATEAQWQALARLMDDASLATDPGLATVAGRWAQHDALDKRISDWTAEWRPYQLMRALQAVGVPAGMVQTAEDLWRDPHLRAREYTVKIEHADDTVGVVEHPGMPVKLHDTPGQIQRRVGPLGEANADVFRGLLGLTPEEIVRLAEAGVIA